MPSCPKRSRPSNLIIIDKCSTLKGPLARAFVFVRPHPAPSSRHQCGTRIDVLRTRLGGFESERRILSFVHANRKVGFQMEIEGEGICTSSWQH